MREHIVIYYFIGGIISTHEMALRYRKYALI